MTKLTREELEKMKKAKKAPAKDYIKVGLSSCGIAAGAQEVYDLLAAEVAKRSLPVTVARCGCSGACYAEPLVQVAIDGLPAVTYGRVNRDVAIRILDEHVRDKRLINDHIVDTAVRR
jgi:(2Fe-2S) ferredoxin